MLGPSPPRGETDIKTRKEKKVKGRMDSALDELVIDCSGASFDHPQDEQVANPHGPFLRPTNHCTQCRIYLNKRSMNHGTWNGLYLGFGCIYGKFNGRMIHSRDLLSWMGQWFATKSGLLLSSQVLQTLRKTPWLCARAAVSKISLTWRSSNIIWPEILVRSCLSKSNPTHLLSTHHYSLKRGISWRRSWLLRDD
jgi:hypothetical protein